MGFLHTFVLITGVVGAALAFDCPESDGHFLHADRCDVYYWCVNNVAHLTHCPPGSFFSTVTNFCNWPFAVTGCRDDGTRVSGWRQPAPPPSRDHLNAWEQDHSWGNPSWDTYLGQTMKDALEKAEKPRVKREAEVKASVYQGYDICGGDDGYRRHEEDCAMYYWCINYVPHLRKCHGDLFYDPVIRRCSWRTSVHDCDSSGKRFQCPNSYGYYRHPETCKSYIWCVEGVPRLQHCPEGNFFVPTIERCFWPWKLRDCDFNGMRSFPEKVPFTHLGLYPKDDHSYVECAPGEDGLWGDPEDCTVYYVCNGGKGTLFACSPGTFFNPSTLVCTWPRAVQDCNADGTVRDPMFHRRRRRSVFWGPQIEKDDGENKRPNSSPEGHIVQIWEETYDCPLTDGYYRHETNCSVYFRCHNRKATRFECNPGTFYNPLNFGCAWPYQVHDCDQETGLKKSYRKKRSIFSAPGQKDPPRLDGEGFICPAMDGYYRHHTDCTVYYWCVGEKYTKQFCPKGTFFNPKKRMCTWPSAVADCEKDGLRISNSPYQSRVREFVCPGDNGYYRHPTECSSYFRCNERKLTVYKCTPGTVFDPINNVCSWPDLVKDCDDDGMIIPSLFKGDSSVRLNPAPAEGTGDNNSNVTKAQTTTTSVTTTVEPNKTSTVAVVTEKANSVVNTTVKILKKLWTSTTQSPTTTTTVKPTTSKTTKPKARISPPTTKPPTTTSPATTTTTTPTTTSTATTATTTTNSGSGGLKANDGFGHALNAEHSPYSVGTNAAAPFTCPQQEGYFADMDDCAAYFHCEHGTAYRRECNPGDFYSPLSQTCIPGELVPDCNYEESADSKNYPEWTKDYYKSYASDFVCPRLHGYYTDDNDCTGYFECINGNAYHRKCNAGTFFDNKKNKCTWDKDSTMCQKAKVEANEGETLAKIEKTGPFVCPQSEGLFRDPKTCTMFYECAEGIPKSRSCGPETLFDDVKKKCTWPDLVKDCDVYGRVISPSEQTLFRNEETKQLEKNPNGFACPLPRGHFRDPRDCSVFYHCVKNVAYKGRCRSHHAFDLLSLKCLDPELVPGCDIAPKIPLVASGSDVPAHFQCQDDGKYRDKDDCSVYFRCKDGVYFRHECKPGTVFSEDRGRCTWPHLVPECEEKEKVTPDSENVAKAPESMSEPGPPSEVSAQPEVDYEIINNSEHTDSQEVKDYITEEPESKLENLAQRPEETKQSDEGSEEAVEESARGSTDVLQADTGFTCPPKADGFHGDPVFCQKFYRCVDDTKYTFSCPAGTFFDAKRYICNFIEEVKDCSDTGLKLAATGNDAPDEQPEQAPVMTPVVATEPSPKCPESDGLFPHPASCSKFLYCARFSPLVLTCPKDLLYNMEKKTCDYSENVVCIRYD